MLADGGTLTILDVAVLPLEIQDLIAQSFARRQNSPIVSSVAKPGLFVTLRVPLTRLLEEQRLSRDLSRWLGASEVLLPTLAERPEDLQPWRSKRCRASDCRYAVEPLGLEPAALRLLAEHDWPGNELEFRARLLSAARRAPGAAVRADDLLATGLRSRRSEHARSQPATAAGRAPSAPAQSATRPLSERRSA